MAQWLVRRTSDQGVPGRCTFRRGLEQITFTPCGYVVPNVLSSRDLVSRPDNMDETVPNTPVDLRLCQKPVFL